MFSFQLQSLCHHIFICFQFVAWLNIVTQSCLWLFINIKLMAIKTCFVNQCLYFIASVILTYISQDFKIP